MSSRPQILMRVLRWFLLLAAAAVILLFAARMASNTPAVQSPSFSSTVIERMRLIYVVGQAKGNRADVFSKVGDSISASPSFLGPIGEGRYQLGDYGYLQPVIDLFSTTPARQGNSFQNSSLAAGVGWAAWGVLDPQLADATLCVPGETPLACEYRLTRPSFALIMFGTNDVGYRSAAEFEGDLRRIIEVSELSGVIPILSTIPERPDTAQRVLEFNNVIRSLASARNAPLWDYHEALRGLPNEGLAWDNLHPSSPPEWFDDAADFRAHNLVYGYVIRNLTALQMLDSVWRAVKS
jgi:hypothetical protein